MNTSLIDKKITKIMTFIMFFCMVYFLLGATSSFAASSGGSDSVIIKIKGVAVNVIEHVKVIAYVLGGFGLVGLAWGAIFGKINWKWFGGLSIGLFLISYMGMTIDYFTGRKNSAANAFKITGIAASNFKDTITEKVQSSSVTSNSVISGRGNANTNTNTEDILTDNSLYEQNTSSGTTSASSGGTSANSGGTSAGSGNTSDNSGGTSTNSGNTPVSSGSASDNSGNTNGNSGGTSTNSGKTPVSSGGATTNSQ